MFIFALVVPIVMSFLVTMVFGDLFSTKPKLGIVDVGASAFTAQADEMDAVILKEFASIDDMMAATEVGGVDIGINLPVDFDQKVAAGEQTEMTAYVWGESRVKDRVMLISAMSVWVRNIAGQESPIEIVTATLGNIETLSWEDRLLPLVVMMSVLIGGVLVPATSLVEEKSNGTLTSLTVTPTTLADIFTSKGMMGVVLSTLTGVLILTITNSFGVNPPLLVFLLFLGAVMAAEFGILLGAFIKDINTLFATVKSMGILLYAPAIVHMFPAIPQWIGKIFPTYYMTQPIVEITQNGASWGEIAGMVYILIGLIVLLGAMLGLIAKRMRKS
jgi:ABC-2 type transport system permease protein